MGSSMIILPTFILCKIIISTVKMTNPDSVMRQKENKKTKGENRPKMAGGFRTESGREMYCEIMSFIETLERRDINIFQRIIGIMNGYDSFLFAFSIYIYYNRLVRE